MIHLLPVEALQNIAGRKKHIRLSSFNFPLERSCHICAFGLVGDWYYICLTSYFEIPSWSM